MRILVGMLLAAAILAAHGAGASETREYTAMVHGAKAGGLTLTDDGRGNIGVHFTFRSNGRGPDIEETWTEGPDGTALRYASKGASTFGAPIRDDFGITGGRARWKSVAEAGEKAVTEPAYYAPVESSPARTALPAGPCTESLSCT